MKLFQGKINKPKRTMIKSHSDGFSNPELQRMFNSLWHGSFTVEEIEACKDVSAVIEKLEQKFSNVYEKTWVSMEQLELYSFIAVRLTAENSADENEKKETFQ